MNYNAIGKDTLDAIYKHYCANAIRTPAEGVEEGTPVFICKDCAGEVIREEGWNAIWKGCPEWWEKAYMLADNGQYFDEDVAAMSHAEIFQIYYSRDFNPEFCYFTFAE